VTADHFRELAAVSEAEEVAAIRTAAERLAETMQRWKASPAWKRDRDGGAAPSIDAAIKRMMAELAELGADAELRAVVKVVMGPLGQYASEPGTAAALEELRQVAMHRPRATEFARQLTGRQDRRDPEPPPRPEIQVHNSQDR
jgi:hypothetical protein